MFRLGDRDLVFVLGGRNAEERDLDLVVDDGPLVAEDDDDEAEMPVNRGSLELDLGFDLLGGVLGLAALGGVLGLAAFGGVASGRGGVAAARVGVVLFWAGVRL